MHPGYGYPAHAQAPNPAATAGIVMLVCAAAIAFGTLTKSWLSASEKDGNAGIGLTGMSFEGEGRSMSMTWGEIDDIVGHEAREREERRREYGEYDSYDDYDDESDEGPGITPTDVKLMGYLGFVLGLLATGAAAGAGGLALMRNLRPIKTKPFVALLIGTSALHAIFLARVVTNDRMTHFEDVDFSISYSGIVSVIGLVAAAVVLLQMLGPQIAQAQAMAPPVGYAPPLPSQPIAMPPVVACPRCHGQATFVAQYNRYFCNACQQYV